MQITIADLRTPTESYTFNNNNLSFQNLRLLVLATAQVRFPVLKDRDTIRILLADGVTKQQFTEDASLWREHRSTLCLLAYIESG